MMVQVTLHAHISATRWFTRCVFMMTSSNGNIFRVAGPLWGEFTCHRWIPLTRASDAELWWFLWSAPGQTAQQIIETPVIWNAIAPTITSMWCLHLYQTTSKMDVDRNIWSILAKVLLYYDLVICLRKCKSRHLKVCEIWKQALKNVAMWWEFSELQ